MTSLTLIIGSLGTLGQECARVFADTELVLWDRMHSDITVRDDIIEKITTLRPSLIVNCAAYNNVDGAQEQKDLAMAVNGFAPGYLAEAAQRINATYVHYSTDYIFDGQKKDGYVEDDAPNPLSVYGASKLAGEHAVIATCKSNAQHTTSSDYYLIRTSRLYGTPGGGTESFVDLMLRLARVKDVLQCVDEEMSSPTYARDLARWTKQLIFDRAQSGVYHGANSGSCTWYGFAKEIFTQAKKLGMIEIEPRCIPVAGDTFPRVANRPRYSILLSTKNTPMRQWKEALHDYLKSVRDRNNTEQS